MRKKINTNSVDLGRTNYTPKQTGMATNENTTLDPATSPLQILVVEDDMIVGTHIVTLLDQAGYEVVGLLTSGEAVLEQLKTAKPDLILMDIALKGDLDGIETSQIILDNYQIPVIYLTANSDPATFERAKATKPFGFISKPFKPVNLTRQIELVITRIADELEENSTTKETVTFAPLDDRIFVRDKDRMVKINLSDIYFAKAERNYCRLFTEKKEYLLSLPLKSFETKIASDFFERVHRSFLVNINRVEEFDEYNIFSLKQIIPISSAHKARFQSRIKTV